MKKIYGLIRGDLDFKVMLNNKKRHAKYQLFMGTINIANFDTEEKAQMYLTGLVKGLDIMDIECRKKYLKQG